MSHDVRITSKRLRFSPIILLRWTRVGEQIETFGFTSGDELPFLHPREPEFETVKNIQKS